MKTMVLGIMRDLIAEQHKYEAHQREIGKACEHLRRTEIGRICAQFELESDESLAAQEKAEILIREA